MLQGEGHVEWVGKKEGNRSKEDEGDDQERAGAMRCERQ